MLRPNSRSCRTASFRPGIAGGLTGELDSDVSRCQCMRHEMRQDEAFDSIWRVTKLEPDRQPTSGTGLMYRRVFPRAKPTGTENSKTKGCPGRGRKERSEIEVRQRAEQQAETRRVRWGSSMSTSQANYDGDFTYGDGTTGEYRGKTVVVESFSPNPWGLYQVHGNSYDCVEDCYHDSSIRRLGLDIGRLQHTYCSRWFVDRRSEITALGLQAQARDRHPVSKSWFSGREDSLPMTVFA
jgi:Sulfatase-modifying factor enzyme 1